MTVNTKPSGQSPAEMYGTVSAPSSISPDRLAQIQQMLQAQSGQPTGGITPQRQAEINAMLAGQQITAPQEKKGNGIIQSIAKPFTKAAATGAAAISSIGKLATSLPGGISQQELNDINTAATRERDFGIFGKNTPTGVNAQQAATGQSALTSKPTGQAIGQFGKDVIGTGLELGSYLAPGAIGAAAKPTLGALAAGGAVSGALGGAGSALTQENTNLGKVLGGAALGGVTGGILGAAIPAAGRAASEAAQSVKRAVNPAIKFAESQVTGLSPETLNTVRELYGDFAPNVPKPTREHLGNLVQRTYENKIKNINGFGDAYNSIRKLDQVIPVKTAKLESNGIGGVIKSNGPVHDVIEKTLNSFGLSVDSNGKILAPTAATQMDRADTRIIQGFIDQFGKKSEITPNELLNIRQYLDSMAGFDKSNRGLVDRFSGLLRHEYDVIGKDNIKGLEKLDNKFSADKEFIDQVKRDLFKANGELKDSAFSRIANIGKKGNELRLQRLEKLSPGISNDVRILQALEDIESSSGQKTGTYIRALISMGGFTGSIAHGNLPLAALFGLGGAVSMAPENLIAILRRYGELQNNLPAFTNSIIKKMQLGKPLSMVDKKFVNDALQRAMLIMQRGVVNANPLTNTNQ